jgi:hypothetical protein
MALFAIVNNNQLLVQASVKYFFLTDGWTIGRVWASDGLWNEAAWRRKPKVERLNLQLITQNETLWLYKVEEVILTIEVKPASITPNAIASVVLKRLMNAPQVIERLSYATTSCQVENAQLLVE